MRKKLSGILAVVVVVLFSVNCSADDQSAQPNIIFILADDLGCGDVNCFNPEGKIATPNLDNMAANGLMFTDAHTSSAVCTPTRYGILTGRYNWRSSFKSSVLSGYSKSLIKQERTTIAEMLKMQGYSTAYIGKWYLGWTYLRLQDIRNEKVDLPSMQLYNLKEDISETKNLVSEYPEKAAELKAALKKIILDGRSTTGAKQKNDGLEGWKQIESIIH